MAETPDISAEALERAARARRFARLERLATRGVLMAGVAVMAAGLLLSHDRALPSRLVAAWVAAFVVLKLVLAALGRHAGWRAWPALLMEGLSFISVGLMVFQDLKLGAGDSRALVLLLLTAVFLATGTWLRRRAALAEWQEQEKSSDSATEGDDNE